MYPAGAGACAAPSATYLLTGLGVRSFTPPIASTPVTINITMKLTAAAGDDAGGAPAVAVHSLCHYSRFGDRVGGPISYPAAMVLL